MLLLPYIADANTGTCHYREGKSRDRGRVPSWTIFPILDEVTHAKYNRSIDLYSLSIL